jgi:hypothetical protein
VLVLSVTLSCSLIPDPEEIIEDVIETEIDLESIETEIESIATEIDVEAIETEFESMETEIGSMVTEIGDLGDVGEIFETPVPGEKPADIPVVDGAEDLFTSPTEVEYWSDKPVSELKDYYMAEMPVNGWTFVSEESEEGYYKLVFEKGVRKATVEIDSFFGVYILIEGG